jgi:polyhydroxyalkanoate synthesis regulator phasin
MANRAIGRRFWRRHRGLKFRGRWIWLVSLRLLAAVSLVAALGVAPALAARDPLLEVLIRKGVLTPEEARQVEKEAKALEQEKEKKVQEQVKEQVTEKVQKAEASVEKKMEKKATAWKVPKALKGLKVGVLSYIDYSVGSAPIAHGKRSLNQFTLTRGYLNVEKEITPWLHARVTPDITQETAGDWKLRLKYLYAELRPPTLGNYLTDMKGEMGLGHIPWLDFEENVNPYRCQGTMAIERAGVFNSADLGVSLRGYFGGRLPNAKQVIGDEHYDGLYGSWHFGVFNGTGYHAGERNDNKALEYRLTLRPLPYLLPGLQASYFGIYGKGNQSTQGIFGGTTLDYFPDWIVHQAFLSYQHPWFILTGQFFAAKGNQAGNWVATPGPDGRAVALWTQGWSVFGDVRLPIRIWGQNRLHAFARHDWFNADIDQVVSRDAKYRKLITGMACEVYKKNLLLLVFERTWYGGDYNKGTGYNGTSDRVADPTKNGTNLGADARFQAVWQISY